MFLMIDYLPRTLIRFLLLMVGGGINATLLSLTSLLSCSYSTNDPYHQNFLIASICIMPFFVVFGAALWSRGYRSFAQQARMNKRREYRATFREEWRARAECKSLGIERHKHYLENGWWRSADTWCEALAHYQSVASGSIERELERATAQLVSLGLTEHGEES